MTRRQRCSLTEWGFTGYPIVGSERHGHCISGVMRIADMLLLVVLVVLFVAIVLQSIE